MQGPLHSVWETQEDKAKPLEGVASYILQMRSSGRNEKRNPEKSSETWEGKSIQEMKVLDKAKKYLKVTLSTVSENLTQLIKC